MKAEPGRGGVFARVPTPRLPPCWRLRSAAALITHPVRCPPRRRSQITPGSRPDVLPPINDPRAGRRVRGLPHDPRTLPMRIGPPGQNFRSSRSNPQLDQRVGPSGNMRASTGPLPGQRPATTTANLTLSSSLQSRRERGDEPHIKMAVKEDVSVDALRLTLKSMAAHEATALVQEYGCGTLFNVIVADPAMRTRLTNEDGVRIVLAAMQQHPMATGVQINACALIKELADFQPALQLIEDGGGRHLLLTALQNHQYNDDLLTRATEALRYLPEEIPLEQ